MVLELHVWGPAFTLPSIDPDCLAIIAYLTQAVPRDRWLLVPSSNPALSPTGQLPALIDGPARIGGFHNIVSHLRRSSEGQWDLDNELSGQQKAESTAFASYIEANGKPLIDLSLYVSSENWASKTRPLYSTILPWPLQYVVPPSIKASAKSRSNHLGVSNIDIDAHEESQMAPRPTTATLGGTQSLFGRSQSSLSALLAKPEHAANIRLDGISVVFFEPLEALLGDNPYLLSALKPSSLDCIAIGYLSLALIPDLPQPWLSQTLRAKFPRLVDYVLKNRTMFLGGAVYSDDLSRTDPALFDIQPGVKGDGILPWAAYRPKGPGASGQRMIQSTLDLIPAVKPIRQFYSGWASRSKDSSEPLDGPAPNISESGVNLPVIALGAMLSALIGYYVYSTGTLSYMGQDMEPRSRNLRDYGVAGASLAVLADRDGLVGNGQPQRSGVRPIVEAQTTVKR